MEINSTQEGKRQMENQVQAQTQKGGEEETAGADSEVECLGYVEEIPVLFSAEAEQEESLDSDVIDTGTDADTDADTDANTDANVEANIEANADANVEANIEANADANADPNADPIEILLKAIIEVNTETGTETGTETNIEASIDPFESNANPVETLLKAIIEANTETSTETGTETSTETSIDPFETLLKVITEANTEDKIEEKIEANIEANTEDKIETNTEDKIETNIDPFETLLKASNGVALATNLLTVSALSVLVKEWKSHQITNVPSSLVSTATTTSPSSVKTESIPDIAISDDSTKPDDSTESDDTLSSLGTKRTALREAPRTTKGKKWRARIVARRQKCTEASQEYPQQSQERSSRNKIGRSDDESLGTRAEAKEIVEAFANTNQSQDCSSQNKIGHSSASLGTQAEAKEIVEAFENANPRPVYDNCNVDFLLFLDSKQDPSETLSSISSEQTIKNIFAQLDIDSCSMGVRWEKNPALKQEEEGRVSGSSTPTKSGIPSDILSIEQSLELSFAQTVREINANNEADGRNKIDDTISENSDCLSFVTARDEIPEETAPDENENEIKSPGSTQSSAGNKGNYETLDKNKNNENITFDMILAATDTINGRLWGLISGGELSSPLSSSPAKDLLELSFEANEITLQSKYGRDHDEQGQSQKTATATSNAKTASDNIERVSIEAILNLDEFTTPSNNNVEVVVYDQDFLSPDTKNRGFFHLCCWFDSSSGDPFETPLEHEKKGCDASLCLTDASSTNSSSKSSTSWLPFSGTKNTKEQPWYVLPTADLLVDNDLLSVFSGSEEQQQNADSNSTNIEDEGFVVSRMSILKELNRLKNYSDSGICYSDRVMEIIHFASE